MNPYLILAGVVALLAFRNSKKGQAPSSSGSAPIPSPANPAGLDAPTGPSPSGVPEVRETTSDPIASPANPTGLDAREDSSPSGVPEVIVAEPEEYVVVDDGNWTESPANPLDLSDIVSPAGGNGTDPIASPANPAGLDAPTGPSTSSDPIASPANPKGLDAPVASSARPKVSEGRIPYSAMKQKFLEERKKYKEGTAEYMRAIDWLSVRTPAQYEFVEKVHKLHIPSYLQPSYKKAKISVKDILHWTARGKYRGQIWDNKEELGLLTGSKQDRYAFDFLEKNNKLDSVLDEYIKDREDRLRRIKLEEQQRKERAAKPKPKVFAGKVLDANGNYVTPKGQQDCPDGYKYISNAGWTGCVTPERYEEWAIKMAYAMNDIPVRLTSWTGIRNGVQVRNSRKFSKFIDYPEHIFKKNISGYGLSYTTSLQGLTNSFEFKDSFWGTKDGKYVVLYGKVRVKMNDGKIQKFYVVYPVTKEEFDKWKQAAYYIELSKKKK